ncbi:MAG: 50S ribosomal protein L4 [Candidatus Omnitrophica bacterium]|nr:50S ribosomal protein L4 [Candidatus Omnitrophota bacterium]
MKAKKISKKSRVKKSAKKKVGKKTIVAPNGLSLPVLSTQGKEVEQIELEKCVFDGKISEALIHQAVVTYLANQRKGLASTKTRGEVRGGGKKPWRQKGTGRARVGSIRSPLWRGGGVTFGPKPHSFYKDLPQKMKTMALKSALNAKLRDKEILILSDLKIGSHKTKDFSKIIKSLKLDQTKVRVVVEKLESDLKLATGNMKKVLLAKASDVHATEIIDCKRLVLTKNALRDVEERIKKCLS